jgi:type IV secretion system protein VirD4
MIDKFNNAVGPQVRAKKKRTGKIVPALAVLTIGGGLQAATQFFAHDFNYQGALGSHINQIYPPWGILQWAGKWHSDYPEAFLRAGSVGVLVSGVGLISLVIVQMVLANSSKVNEYLHGSARWANIKDIRAAGLIPKGRSLWQTISGKGPIASAGVYVGAWVDKDGKQHYLRHNGPEHVLCYAPTRSGKGVGLVVPTLLSWGHSAVITDLKGELWALTSGWRQQYAKNKVLRFEPATSNGSVCWNPLNEIRLETENEVGDVQNLVTLIVDPDGKGLESHWQKTSQALLVGVVLHALYKAKEEGTPASLPSVDAMLSDPNRDIAELWMEMTTYSHFDGMNHPVVGSAARDMMDRPDEEAGSVLSTAKSYLSLYRDPVVARNVSKSEFAIKDLMHHDNPVSLYIVTQPNDKARLRPLVRIMVNMIVRLLADKMDFENGRPVAHYKHRLLMMLDEFPSLGKLGIMEESLAFVAGYGIKCYLICQDINQLKSRETGYGQDESITSNCHVQNAYPPNRVETAEHLSKLTGQTTIAKEQITTSGRRTSALLGQVSRTIQEVQRPLLTPDECLRMPGPVKTESGDIAEAGDMVIYVAGYPAIYGKQPLYFQDPTFQARAAIPAPERSDKLRQIHEIKQGEGITL